MSRQAIALTGPGIGTSYNSNDPSGPQAQVKLTFKTDGTWAVTVDPSDDTLTGAPSTGTWLTSAIHAALFEIKYTATAGPSAAGVVTNDASAFTALSANRSIYLDLSGTAPDTDSITVTVDVRQILNTANAIQDTGIVMDITFT